MQELIPIENERDENEYCRMLDIIIGAMHKVAVYVEERTGHSLEGKAEMALLDHIQQAAHGCAEDIIDGN